MILTILATLAIQAQSKQVEAKRIYQYLDSLNYGFLGKPLVEVTTHQVGGGQTKKFGFLMKPGNDFQALDLHLTDIQTKELRINGSYAMVATYRVLDQKSWPYSYVTRLLPSTRQGRAGEESNIGPAYPPQDFAAVAVVARVLASRGDMGTANRLISSVVDEFATGDSLEEQLAKYADRQILDDISNVLVPREDLLQEARNCLRRYPKVEDRKLIEEVFYRVGASIVARRTHVKPNSAKASRAQMIAEWIYDLENVYGRPNYNPSQFSVYMTPHETSSVKNLTSAGLEAVPALIQALDDRRFTFAVGDNMRGSPSLIQIRVRDCAAQILSKISGDEIWPSGPQTMDDAAAAAAKRKASWWFASARKHGEVAILERQLLKPRPDVATSLSRLAAIAPKRVIPALRAANFEDRDLLAAIAIVDRLPIPEGHDFVRKTMVNGKDRGSRLLAASLVSRYDEHAAAAAMLSELDRPIPEPKPFDIDYSENLDMFLVHSGQERAIRAVTTRLDSQEMWFSVGILASLTSPYNPLFYGSLKFRGNLNSRTPAERAAASGAMEDLCAKKLEDTRSTIGGGKFQKEFRYVVPRVSDYAALALARLYPSVYHYYEPSSEAKSEALRVEALNIYRRRHGLPPVHDVIYGPPMRPERDLDAALIAATSRDSVRRRAALQTIQTQGLPSLSPLLRKADALPKNDPSRADISATARQISMTITGVKVWRATTAEERQIRPRRGVPLTGPGLRALVRRVQNTPGAVMILARAGDLSGVRFEFAYSDSGGAKATGYYRYILIGEKRYETGGSLRASSKDLIEDLEPEIQRVFAADPRTPFRFEVSTWN